MKVVLLGDSIRLIGYGKTVEEQLRKEGHEVFQPEDNCRFVKYLLRCLFDYREQIKDANVIHFNAGLWDVCTINDDEEVFTSIEEYKDNLRRVTKLLLKITPNVIFATTTPVRIEHPYNDNKVIDKYNVAAKEVMKELNVRINDLNSLLRNDINKYIREDDLIHLTDDGIKVCAEQVLESIHRIIG